jgi:predicted ATPase
MSVSSSRASNVNSSVVWKLEPSSRVSVDARTRRAIFGIPTVHEDDALRAARAATEMRERLSGLRDELEGDWGAWLELRIGISTGEVVTGGDSDQPYATGEPVQSALRLHQAAQSGDVLVDERTHRLVRDAVDAETHGEHSRLLGVRPVAAGFVSRFDSPMVGREREQRRLQDAFAQAIGDRSCQLFTILGAPGVGKSRLVREFVDGVSGRALVARGRCLPYGEGITYWPILEAVRDAADLDDTDSTEELAKLASLLEGEEEADLAAQRLGDVIGLTQGLSGAEESFWAVRTFFETLARRHPLVLVFDDIHWGEATFLDLVDHISDWTRDAPVLLVCVARPELLDVRPHWGGGKLNATSVLLEPLSEPESVQLLDNLASAIQLEDAVRRQIVERAGGNPLFVEEMLALVREGGHLEVPPTIQALLAARLDRLDGDERSAIEAASVEGKVFHEGSVDVLCSIDPPSSSRDHLNALVRKDLIRSDSPVFSGERAFRFRHQLIRDAAYASIPKEARAELHERHAVWLERKAADRAVEFEEILGYHLEQAFRYRADLGPLDDSTRALGVLQPIASVLQATARLLVVTRPPP